MKATLSSIFFLVFFASLNAQYYYQDIVTNKQTNMLYKQLRIAGIKKISATSYDGDEASKDFVLEQTISGNGRQILTRSGSINTDISFFISDYDSNRLAHTIDSSKNATNTVDYYYDKAGRITMNVATSKDFDGTYTLSEKHVWTYNDKGQPESMIKVKNDLDSTFVTFDHDEAGNVSSETWRKNNRTIETYQYYYNGKKQLTDVVRYNARAQKLIPDLMFEYDNASHLSQMTQTQGGIANYLVWKYTYNDNGLKQKELVYSKHNELLGRIEYRY